MLELEFAQLSDPGLVREHNEDYLGYVVPRTTAEARTHGWLFALADGVGGQDRGEVASRTAVESLIAGFRSSPGGEPVAALLTRIVRTANTRVFEEAMTTGPASSTMATTIVACALRFDRATVAHVGDSRCYLIRRGCAAPLTRDHTISSEQLRMRLISQEEAASAQTAHVLSRSVGNEMFVSVDTSEHQLLEGDTLLLCSDGLHNCVSTCDMIKVTAHTADLNQAAHDLVELAKQRDGSDNVSVQLIRIRGVERVGMYRGRHYRLN